MIKTLNLGDSGYMILKSEKNFLDYLKFWKFKDPSPLKKKFKSKEQQYSFNFPYQCGTSGDGTPEQKDLGLDAIEKEHKVKEYDIIVMASDGVWDNLFEKDIIECVQ